MKRFFALCLVIATSLGIVNNAAAYTKEKYGTTSTGVDLFWYSFTTALAGPRPAILVIHAGGFKAGNPGSLIAAQDLANAGYWTLAIEYRLAPPAKPMQPRQSAANDNGLYPKQTADVQMAILRARIDPRCNGLVAAVGGSAGGSHTVYCAGIGTKGGNKLDAGVSLSGAYDFHDPTSLFDPLRPSFAANVYNYVGSSNATILDNASPYKQINASVAPLYIIASDNDPMPLHQFPDLINALNSAGATNYQALLRPNSSLHGFDYWPDVRDSVIAFFDRWLIR